MKWKEISKEPPTNYEEVMMSDGKNLSIGFYFQEGEHLMFDDYCYPDRLEEYPEYWAKLPNAPKKSENL